MKMDYGFGGGEIGLITLNQTVIVDCFAAILLGTINNSSETFLH